MKSWVEERWPLSSFVRLALEEEIPGGSSFAYTLGSSVLIVFILQAVTGIMQLFFYVPAVDHAYNSISYLRTRVPFGWLIHGLHYWGANIMAVLVLLHITRVFLWGAYKRPRELTWLAGVTLLLTVMAFSFTGTPLHWDQRGYRIGEMSTSIAGTVPLVGDLMKLFLRGGEEMGQLALSRLFGLHVAVLPLLLVVLFGIHIVAMRRFGSVGPWDERRRSFKGPFWPDQVYKDTVTGTSVLLLLIALAVFLPPAYTGPADPLDASYIPQPEWNFLFLYEALKYFEGPLEPVGTVGVPAVLLTVLFLIPFVDRNPQRDPLKRPFAMLFALIFGSALLILTIKGYNSPGFARMSSVPAATMAVEKKRPVVPAGDRPVSDTPVSEKLPGPAADIIGSAERGVQLFATHCSSCHGPLGKTIIPNLGSHEGMVPDLNPIDPDLYDKDAQTFAENIDRFIQHGSVPAGPKPTIVMPAFGDTNTLTQQEIANVEAFVLSLNGADRAQLINPGVRPRRFFIAVAFLYLLAVLIQAGIRFRRKIP